jgi:hypothetical protein
MYSVLYIVLIETDPAVFWPGKAACRDGGNCFQRKAGTLASHDRAASLR